MNRGFKIRRLNVIKPRLRIIRPATPKVSKFHKKNLEIIARGPTPSESSTHFPRLPLSTSTTRGTGTTGSLLGPLFWGGTTGGTGTTLVVATSREVFHVEHVTPGSPWASISRAYDRG